MSTKMTIGVLAASILIAGCASRNATPDGAPASAAAPATTKEAAPSTPGARVVPSRNGQFTGEIVGTPAPGSRFSKVQIGMTLREVTDLIGVADDMDRHETGKRWIPFYFGNDTQRLQMMYKGEGCLTFTGGNAFGGGGNELIRITAAPKGGCMG